MKTTNDPTWREDPTWRRAPHNLEAEQALLGAMLVHSEAYERVADFLEPHHFYDPLHQQIYEIAAKLITDGKRVTPTTLKAYFDNDRAIDGTITAVAYLGTLAVNAVTVINARDYGQVIYDMAVRRHLILIGGDMVNAAYDAAVDFPPNQQIEEAERRLYALTENKAQGGPEVSAAAMTASAFEVIEQAYKNRDNPTGLSTGLKDLDDKMGRLQPSDLVILAGRPSMGKTALAVNIIAAQAGHVHFFSAEMSEVQIGLRLLSAEAELPVQRLMRGDLDEAAWHKILPMKEQQAKRQLTVDPTGGISIAQLATRARRIKRKKGTSLIVVDYLQLMSGSKRSDNRVAEVTEITKGLKALAKELNVPILALSQLSRAVEGREDKHPRLDDLRESGSIEQDADVVMFVFRESYYVERNQPSDAAKMDAWIAACQRVAGTAEVIVAKYRNGPAPSMVRLQFDGELTRFADLVLGSYSAHQPSKKSTSSLKAPKAPNEYQQRLHERIAP